MADTMLPVPFTSEVPDGRWVGPWKNACEEASVVMVESYYLGQKTITKSYAKQTMQKLFAWEDKKFGSNANTNATDTAKMLNEYSSISTTIVRHPALEEIKAELDAQHPVIALLDGFDLNNPNIPFLQSGSGYHAFVIKGYDDATQEFIVNDDGDDIRGLDYRYSYDTIFGSLHDYNVQTKKTDGAPTVLFTEVKRIVKVADKPQIYLIQDGQKHYVAKPAVFKNHRWSWAMVQPISPEELAGFPAGAIINN